MANFTPNHSHSGQLVGSTVDKITLVGRWEGVEILNRDGSAEIYVRTDGVDPVVGADECYALPAAIGSIVLPDTADIRLISTGTPKYTVAGLVN